MKQLLDELRHRVTVQSFIRIADQQGGFQEKWEDRDSIWIRLTPLISPLKTSPPEGRGQRQGTLESKGRCYQGVARASVTLKKGFRLKRQDMFLIIMKEPYIQGLYQSFYLDTVPESDGAFYE